MSFLTRPSSRLLGPREGGQSLGYQCAGDRTITICKSGQQSSGGSGKRKARARRPGLFEVQKINPPPQSLGIHNLPVDTHNGDQITVEDEDFVVTSLVLKYKLVGGRYQRDHNRLEVQQTNRYLMNLYYDGLLERS
ncbi:g6306 [Coccomyxa viridis]|uniref:G6306 protein n=1 Tax=Coccomyxa viridis TaxID=1274662 RepID=A0ABP1FV26_9CHLO